MKLSTALCLALLGVSALLFWPSGADGQAVAPSGSNVNAASVSNTPAGNLAATNAQAALNELQTELDTVTPIGASLSYTHGPDAGSLAYNTETALTFPNPEFDDLAGADAGLNPFTWIVPASGTYSVYCQIYIQRTTAGFLTGSINVYRNGVIAKRGLIMDSSSATISNPQVTAVLKLTAGDVISLYGQYSDGTGSGTKQYGGQIERNWVSITRLR
jgi:hypothetical protein